MLLEEIFQVKRNVVCVLMAISSEYIFFFVKNLTLVNSELTSNIVAASITDTI